MKNLVDAIENLQVKMYNMEDMILSNGKKEKPRRPEKETASKEKFCPGRHGL